MTLSRCVVHYLAFSRVRPQTSALRCLTSASRLTIADQAPSLLIYITGAMAQDEAITSATQCADASSVGRAVVGHFDWPAWLAASKMSGGSV